LADGQIALIVDCDALAAGLGGPPPQRSSAADTADKGDAALAAAR
jgi:hypothetical protein